VKRLTLMRHGDAQWKDPDVADFDRPLNRRGNSEAEALARRLAELKLVPALLIASSALRAHQTAEIVARELGLTVRQIRRAESLYLANAQDILEVVRATGPRVPHLMIVGHNPGITELARLLAPKLCDQDLATGAMCSLTFDTRTWSGVAVATFKDSTCEAPPTGLFRIWA